LDKSHAIDALNAFFAPKGYMLVSRSDNVYVFQSEKREINWVVILVLCCLGVIWAIIYYFIFAQKHQVTVSFFEQDGTLKVSATGNTKESREFAAEAANMVR
jgi:hypothetical protein